MNESKEKEAYGQQNQDKPQHFEKNVTKTISKKGPKFGSRHVQIILMLFGLIFAIAMRTNLSVAIVSMTANSTNTSSVPTYDWNSANVSYILSSFFWSYIWLQVLAGYLGKTYGHKYFLLCAYSINCCGALLIPLAAEHFGYIGVIGCRILQGFGQSFLYPSATVILGKWAPVEERSTLSNFMFSGVYIGTIMGSLITGYFCDSSLGWPYAFYFFGTLGGVWAIIWSIFGQNSPASDPKISNEEKKYIQASLNQEDNLNIPVPWKKIFTCIPFYALLLWTFSSTWCYSMIMTEIPTYLSKVMNYDVKSSGMVSSIPTAMTLITILIIGPLSDWIISNNYLRLVTTRRIFTAIASYGQASCLLILSYINSSQAHISILILSLNGVFISGALVGASVGHLDLSPRFAGIMHGFINGCSQCFSIAAPLITNWFVTDVTNASMWKKLFIFSSIFHAIGATIYMVFVSATRQPWDGPESRNAKTKKISVVSLSGL
ncbi:putative inorganic phosphate cotransporter [Rhynchophorus ferrugineus]|uniref:putative inorganic phosphate cotransporter n=1 Tax=Rhynchophorus ferrugineus TaxID=354439 RepID=UPI003FCE1B78